MYVGLATPQPRPHQQVEHDVHVQVPVSQLDGAVVQQPTQQLRERLDEGQSSFLLHLGMVLDPLRQPAHVHMVDYLRHT